MQHVIVSGVRQAALVETADLHTGGELGCGEGTRRADVYRI